MKLLCNLSQQISSFNRVIVWKTETNMTTLTGVKWDKIVAKLFWVEVICIIHKSLDDAHTPKKADLTYRFLSLVYFLHLITPFAIYKKGKRLGYIT